MAIEVLLYDAQGNDRSIATDDIAIAELGENQLLWIDVFWNDSEPNSELCDTLGIDSEIWARTTEFTRPYHLDNYGNFFAFRVKTPSYRLHPDDDAPDDRSQSLAFIVAKRWLLTIHDKEIKFLTAFRAQDKGETAIGAISPALLTASLLDWLLAEYFTASSLIEADVDKTDEHILANGADRKVLNEIVAARRLVSELRSLISSQRPIFHGLARPDFVRNLDDSATAQFNALANRFDRAVDEVERTRDVVMGSFGLFTSMNSEETNDLVKSLTFVTAIIGFSAAVAGLLGMNFEAPFFKSGQTGFIVATSLLVGFSIIAIIVAKLRKWI